MRVNLLEFNKLTSEKKTKIKNKCVTDKGTRQADTL